MYSLTRRTLRGEFLRVTHIRAGFPSKSIDVRSWRRTMTDPIYKTMKKAIHHKLTFKETIYLMTCVTICSAINLTFSAAEFHVQRDYSESNRMSHSVSHVVNGFTCSWGITYLQQQNRQKNFSKDVATTECYTVIRFFDISSWKEQFKMLTSCSVGLLSLLFCWVKDAQRFKFQSSDILCESHLFFLLMHVSKQLHTHWWITYVRQNMSSGNGHSCPELARICAARDVRFVVDQALCHISVDKKNKIKISRRSCSFCLDDQKPLSEINFSLFYHCSWQYINDLSIIVSRSFKSLDFFKISAVLGYIFPTMSHSTPVVPDPSAVICQVKC